MHKRSHAHMSNPEPLSFIAGPRWTTDQAFSPTQKHAEKRQL